MVKSFKVNRRIVQQRFGVSDGYTLHRKIYKLYSGLGWDTTALFPDTVKKCSSMFFLLPFKVLLFNQENDSFRCLYVKEKLQIILLILYDGKRYCRSVRDQKRIASAMHKKY